MTIPSIFKEKKSDLILLTILSLTIILSRLPFMSHFLYEWDSVNYALAFQHFNIYLSQPQPPGYIFFIALGRIVNIVFNDPNTSMVFISIVFSILTVFLVYFLAKQMFSRKIAIIASVLLIFNPIFWFYGETSTIYMGEALFATLIAYTSYQMLKGDNRFIYISAIALGLSGGFRSDLIFLMFPLWFFCLIYQGFDYKKIFKSFIVLIEFALFWYIPTILLSGGYLNYSQVTKKVWLIAFGGSSIFFGANLQSQLMMDYTLLSWTLDGIGILSIFILSIYIALNFNKFTLSILRNSKAIFLILWIFPSFLFYFLIYIPKPGYTLIYVPVFVLVISYVIVNFSSNLNKKIKGIPSNYLIILLLVLCVFFSITQFTSLSPNPKGIDYGNIQSKDLTTQYFIESLNDFNPNDTLIFFTNEDDWRKYMYYYTNYESLTNLRYNVSGKTNQSIIYYKNHKSTDINPQNNQIILNSSTKYIIWMVTDNSNFGATDNFNYLQELQSQINVETITFSDGYNIYYSEIGNNTNINIDNLTITKD